MQFLVTGGAGFIGSHIVERLVKEGGKVIVIDNLSTGKTENVEKVIDKIRFIEGDIRDYELLLSITEGVDYIFHEAAMTSVVKSIEDPKTCNEINITGTLNILNASLKNNVKKVIFASSSAVYGDSPILPKREDMTLEPTSPYAISKYTGELYLKFFWEVKRLPCVSLRYFNVYGPRQDPNSPYSAVIPKFISALLSGQSPIIYGDGKQTRDFVFVEDVVEANLKAVEKEGVEGKVYNIGTGKKTSVTQLFQIIKNLIGIELNPIYKEERPGEIKDSFADISMAEEELSFKPKFSLVSGLEKTIEWYKYNLQNT